jgi:hypothetical protein
VIWLLLFSLKSLNHQLQLEIPYGLSGTTKFSHYEGKLFNAVHMHLWESQILWLGSVGFSAIVEV